MNNEKKKELFPYFAFKYSKKLNPGKYGAVTDPDQWIKLLESDKEDMNKVTEAASLLPDSEWEELEKELNSNDIPYAKNGAKLESIKKLQSFKKGKKVTTKKCSCGCSMIDYKEDGGKMTSKCSCGCSVGKKQIGGIMSKKSISKKDAGSDYSKKQLELEKSKSSNPKETTDQFFKRTVINKKNDEYNVEHAKKLAKKSKTISIEFGGAIQEQSVKNKGGFLKKKLASKLKK